MVKARFAAGRFIEGDGTAAVLALPNAPHRDACEALRPQVEAALAAHFGVPVPLRLVVDGEAPSNAPAPAANRDEDDAPPDDQYDLGELVDAPPENAVNPIERVALAFPGAQLVDDERP